MSGISNSQTDFSKIQPFKLPAIKDNPVVSVLMANYNYEKFITEAIESVLAQTYLNWELIICDDGSTDNSIEIVGEYCKKDRRIKLLRKKNGGQASALNEAYYNSSGEIISILDADDTFFSVKLEKVVDAFKRDSQSGFCIHKVLPINAQGKQINKPIPVNLSMGFVALEAIRNGGKANVPPASGLSIRREVANYVLPLPTEFNSNADGILSELAQYITSIVSINEPLASYRLHSDNTTSAFTNYPNEETIKKGDEKIFLFEKTNKEFLLRNFGHEIAQEYNFKNRSDYWEGRLALYILRSKPGEGIDGYSEAQLISFIKNKYRKFLWKIIIALPKKISIKVLKLWWSPSQNKKYFSFISKNLN